MNKILMALSISVVFAAATVYATKPEENIELGYPAVGRLSNDPDDKMQLAIYKGVVLVLRPDGSVGWKLSPKLRERFDEDMKSGKPTPSFFKTTLIPAK